MKIKKNKNPGNDRRAHESEEMEIKLSFFVGDEQISAESSDIREEGIGVIIAREIEPGTKVHISIKYIEDYSIYGIVKWSTQVLNGPANSYRMGIETKNIFVVASTNDPAFTERYKSIKRLLDDISMKL